MVFLEIGAGEVRRPNYDLNIDLERSNTVDVVAHACFLPLRDSSVNGILSSHFIEHLCKTEVQSFLLECYRVLMPNSSLITICPNFQVIVDKYLRGGFDGVFKGVFEGHGYEDAVVDCLFGRGTHKHDFHRTAFDYYRLTKCLQAVGFKNTSRLTEYETEPRERIYSLCVQAWKV